MKRCSRSDKGERAGWCRWREQLLLHLTYKQTELHHYIYIVSLAGGRQNKQKCDKHTYTPSLYIYQHCHMVFFYRHHHHHQHCQMNIFLSCMNILFDHHQHYREVIDITIVVSYVSLLAIIYPRSGNFIRFSLSPLMQLMLQCHSMSLKQYQCN